MSNEEEMNGGSRPKRRYLDRVLGGTVSFSVHHPWIVLGIALFMVVISMIPASQLQVDSSVEGMFGEDDPNIKRWMDINDRYGEQELVTVVVDCSDSSNRTAENYILDLVPALYESGDFREIRYSTDMDFAADNAPLYLPREQLEYLMTPNLTIEEANAWYEAVQQGLSVPNYIVSEDGTLYLVNMNLNITLDDVEVRNRVFDGLYDIIEEVQDRDPDYEELEVGFTGGMMVMDYEGDKMALGDMYITAAFTFVLILIILFISFRSLSLPVLAVVPLVVGIIITAGIIYLVFGDLSFFTSIFAVLLLGLGIDFCVHLLSRFMDEIRENGDTGDALKKTYVNTGKGVILGALTTSMVFFALYFGETEAVHEMGVTAAMGLLITMVCVFTLLPALTILRLRHGKLKERLQRKKRKEFDPLGVIGHYIGKFSIPVLIIMILIGAFFIYKAPEAEVSGDMTEIQPKGVPTYEQLEKIKDHFNYTENYVLITVQGYDGLLSAVEELSGYEEVLQMESILDYLPPGQEEKLDLLSSVMENNTPLAGLKWMDQDPMSWEDIPEQITGSWVHGTSNGYEFLIRLTMKGDVFDEEYREEIYDDMEGINGNITSQAEVFSLIIDIMINDVLQVSVIAAVPIFFIVYIGFRKLNPIYAVLAFVPVIFGLLGIMALYRYTDVTLNVISILMAPLVIGIGIDNGIHLIHRYREEGKGSIPLVLKSTGRAIFLTTATTVLAFSSFTIAEHPGMRSLGRVPVLGLTICFLAAIIFLPALLATIFELGRNGK